MRQCENSMLQRGNQSVRRDDRVRDLHSLCRVVCHAGTATGVKRATAVYVLNPGPSRCSSFGRADFASALVHRRSAVAQSSKALEGIAVGNQGVVGWLVTT